MDITGWDNVIFTCCPLRDVYRYVLTAVRRRWPAALVQDLDAPNPAAIPTQQFDADRLPEDSGHLLFVRDHAMSRHMDAAAYTPMPDGDGPFAVFARARSGVMFRCDRLDEVRFEGQASQLGRVEPYPAWLCSPRLFELTVITPDDPDAHPFSQWVTQMVRSACLEHM